MKLYSINKWNETHKNDKISIFNHHFFWESTQDYSICFESETTIEDYVVVDCGDDITIERIIK